MDVLVETKRYHEVMKLMMGLYYKNHNVLEFMMELHQKNLRGDEANMYRPHYIDFHIRVS